MKPIKRILNLSEYLDLGGKIKNLDVNSIDLDYTADGNYKKKIVNIEQPTQADMIRLTFVDGVESTYSIMWIRVKVEIRLHNLYTI